MMDAGRDLDALIAEKVMGIESKIDYGYAVPTQVFRDQDIPGEWYGGALEYSTDLAAAWLVVEHLHGRVVIDHWFGNAYKVMIYLPSSGSPSVEASADTAPLALCRAALAAVGVEGR